MKINDDAKKALWQSLAVVVGILIAWAIGQAIWR